MTGILDWAKSHTEAETMELLNIEEITDERLNMSNTLMIIRAAYLYLSIEKDRAEDLERAAYLRGQYHQEREEQQQTRGTGKNQKRRGA